MMRFLRLVAALIIVYSPFLHAQEEKVDKDFFFACSGGETDEVWKYLQEHPGECCTGTTNMVSVNEASFYSHFPFT